MWKFFDSITALVGMVVDFVISVFNMIIFLFTQIPKAIAYVVTVSAFLPPFLSTFVLLFVGIIVILNVMNKGS